MNKQSGTAERGNPPALGLDRGLLTIKNNLLWNVTQDLRFGQILWNNLFYMVVKCGVLLWEADGRIILRWVSGK